MKTVSIYFFALIAFFHFGFAQESNTVMPAVKVQTSDFGTLNTGNLENGGNPILLFFWTTWCHHSESALTNISDEYYTDWQEDYNLKIVAVSIDDARNAPKVGPFANGKGWEYEVFLDQNGDLKRAMGVNNAPHLFLLNGKKEIIWQQQGFNDGDEELVEKQLSSISSEAPPSNVKEGKVLGNCGMCKKTIEKAALGVRGVEQAEWNKTSHVLTVTYDQKVFQKKGQTFSTVMKAVAEAGYDNESFKAPDTAYSALPGCCQYDRSGVVEGE